MSLLTSSHRLLSFIPFITYLSLTFLFPAAFAQASSQNYGSISSHATDHLQHRALRLTEVTPLSSGQNDFTCGPDRPCVNGACCGEDGWCGYGPVYCEDGCQSNCDAKAECGRFAATPGQECPLNVCCSEHGFCGTTEDFCNDKCQSNCDDPIPGGVPSNPRDVVIGYWEAWNMDKPCGTMGPGEIPVHLLTHLFVSFGYINSAWEITNMDGIDPAIYRNVPNVKARNPDLKVIIALGGWAFSDPGPWRDIFPTMVSTKENRATFIKNLMGFLVEYGYDGVDFDWEYPGAEDRGGSDADARNYVSLLKELRQAVEASSREYIITFTAPSSYWYLRHFDLKAMEAEVDWINLMSYDLHGVWDSENPIGAQVLAHTNLTEIDHALDLFWRVGVNPQSIVLGLGFYGRSFELESSSCWKPGCAFRGPGAEGRCSKAAGILAYNEIIEIVEKTGGKPYFDKVAAAKYMVYDGHSWISFDDEETFQLKIEYASQIGLRGLMIWAIDLDTGSLEALRAVTGTSFVPGSNSPFGLVDLENLFPPELLPPSDTPTSWGLVNFGSNADTGSVDPNETGFGFVLVTGEPHALVSLKRRRDNLETLVFLDCPEDVSQQPVDKVQTARVVCLSESVKACFQMMERGVGGTLVEMPDNCGRNLFARAIALERSADQNVPRIKGRRAPTSEVFDFSFDLDMKQKRQDAGKMSVRVDYSNTNGYWNAAVDSPGAGASLKNRDKRYWSSKPASWRTMYNDANDDMKIGFEKDSEIQQKIGTPVYWDDVEDCKVDDESYSKGIGVNIDTDLDVQFTYGFSMVSEMDKIFDVKQANGWLKVSGEAELTFAVGGVGKLDLDKSGHGNPAWVSAPRVRQKQHRIRAGPSGMEMVFTPYWELDYMLAAFNETEGGSASPSGPYFDGQLVAKVITDFGDYRVYFPPNPDDTDGSRNVDRKDNILSFPKEYNKILNAAGNGGRIALTSGFTFGLDVKLEVFGDRSRRMWDLVDMTTRHSTTTEWEFKPKALADPEVCLNTFVGTIGYQQYEIDEDDTLGWGEDEGLPSTIRDFQMPASGETCFIEEPSIGLNRRWGYGPGESVDPLKFMPMDTGNNFGSHKNNLIQCENCVECSDPDDSLMPCCGCVNLNLVYPRFDDIPSCPSCNEVDTADVSWPGARFGTSLVKKHEHELGMTFDVEGRDSLSTILEERAPGIATMSPKKVRACNAQLGLTRMPYTYPAFPESPSNPWDGIQGGKWDSILKYYGNTSASCTHWQVEPLTQADTALVNGARIRDRYQTEHVFEGQLIGDFFTMWLDKGYIKNQRPMPANPRSMVPCSFVRRYILAASQAFPWRHTGGTSPVSFIDLMLAELGNESHLDRLTILKARPNRMKGSMFTGNEPTNRVEYAQMTPDEKLTHTEEFGMVFTYLNRPEVWQAFCGTYEAIYDLLGEWDDWWVNNGAGATLPSLQGEWKEYIETVLTSLVRRSLETFEWQRSAGQTSMPLTLGNIAVYQTLWLSNRLFNKQLIRLNGRCNNLGAIRP